MKKIIPPLNLQNWIEENKNLLKPPVSNKIIYTESEDYLIMVVGGPNTRKDFHYNETEEMFYQLKGNIFVTIQIDNKPQKIEIKEGELFLLPARIPHNPSRGEDTLGLVIERKRTPDMKDGLFWYCEKCNNKLKNYFFNLTNIENDFLPRFKEFYSDTQMRTCNKCNFEMSVDKRYI